MDRDKKAGRRGGGAKRGLEEREERREREKMLQNTGRKGWLCLDCQVKILEAARIHLESFEAGFGNDG